MSEHPDLTGQIIAGRYRIDHLIGQGGFATIYRATHIDLGRPVAIKLITEPSSDLLARFEREAQMQDRLNSRFIVRLRDFGRHEGLPFIVQDLIEGIDLEQLVDRDGPLSPGRAVAITRQVCLALDEAHLHGIIHRDIKPGNVMLVETPRGEEIRLLDFGIAKAIDEGERALKITRQGQVFGTLAYMAPEQIRGLPASAATDLYAVGGLLYTLLTGDLPYAGSVDEVISQHLAAPIPRLPDTCPFELDGLIQRAMAKEPADRYPSAEAMAGVLGELYQDLADHRAPLHEGTVVDPELAARVRALSDELNNTRPPLDATRSTATLTEPAPPPVAPMPGDLDDTDPPRRAPAGLRQTAALTARALDSAATPPAAARRARAGAYPATARFFTRPVATLSGAPPDPSAAEVELAATVGLDVELDATAISPISLPSPPHPLPARLSALATLTRRAASAPLQVIALALAGALLLLAVVVLVNSTGDASEADDEDARILKIGPGAPLRDAARRDAAPDAAPDAARDAGTP